MYNGAHYLLINKYKIELDIWTIDFRGRVGIELDTARPCPPGKIRVSDFTELDDFTSSVCRPSKKGNFELDCQPCSINRLRARFNPSSFRENRAR